MSKQLVIVAGNHGCDDGDALGFVLRSKCWGSVLCEDLGGDMLWFNQVRSCQIFVCFGLCIYIRVITAVCCSVCFYVLFHQLHALYMQFCSVL